MADEHSARILPAGSLETADGHERMLGATQPQSPRVVILRAHDRSPNLGVRAPTEERERHSRGQSGRKVR